MSLATATRLGPYEILEPLGAGGMGEVYRAIDTRLDRTVALKVLPSDFLEGEERKARFEKEAKLLAALNHPNIATIYSFEEISSIPLVSPPRHVLTMELLEGESLREVLLRRTPNVRQVLSWAVQAAQGLAAAHRKGIVHRDIKPENLFLTTDGRLKILDFGVAKQSQLAGTASETASRATGTGAVMGTLSYLSPEQAEGLPVDARSDLFSFGIVLYELLARKHPFRKETAGATVAAILKETPEPVSSVDASIPRALDAIVLRCLEKERDARFQGAHDLGLALGSVLGAPAGSAVLTEVEERSPYPGIASFTEKDAGLFFGRDGEVKAFWDRVRVRRMLALIGPSGAGKTSFLRAGALPARPDGWAAIVATPGVSPFRGLGQALSPELLTDADAIRQLVNVDDPVTAYQLAMRWRRRHPDAVLVVDQFEELFTLNAVETQAAFSTLLARLAEDGGVHVVLSLRDDFLMRCHEHAPLLPVFDALMPLGPLTPEAMARALTEPAKKRGYRFEDEALVDEMVTAVEGERGALPLLAFAVARLWELRDREAKLLTRDAYLQIGGVAGALARHAEATMDRIGASREPVVRDLFRSLVTAQATRTVADRDELLSAFPDRGAAEDVLRALVDARLLTSYEPESEGGAPGRCRIEIVHESLLKAWPRLVRWQAQEEEGAVLRDQLRQAAHLWEDKGRTGDLLWTGTAFQEFELWRGRYPGVLTAVEEDFGAAMRERAHRSQRLKRVVVAAALLIVSAVAIAIGISRQKAVVAARQAEASKLLATAELRLSSDPTEALALVTASLELEDTPEARIFALKDLWEAPPAVELAVGIAVAAPNFSPDGRQLATDGYTSDAHVLDEEGGELRALNGHRGRSIWLPGRLVLIEDKRRASVWSLPGLALERTVELGDDIGSVSRFGTRLLFSSRIAGGGPPSEVDIWSWDPADAAPVGLGRVPRGTFGPDGASWLHARGATLLRRPLRASSPSADVALGEHRPEIANVIRAGTGNEVLTLNPAKEMRLWTFEAGKLVSGEDFPTPAGADPPVGLKGRWMHDIESHGLLLWQRGSWPAARPLLLKRNVSWFSAGVSAHPSGDWYVASTDYYNRLTFWPLRKRIPLVVDGQNIVAYKLVSFSPDGRWLASSWPDAPIRLWPLAPGSTMPKTLSVPGMDELPSALAFDPHFRFLVCVGGPIGRYSIWVVPLDDRPPSRLEGFSRVPWIMALAVSPSGRFVAAASAGGSGDRTLRAWDLETNATRAWDLPLRPPRPGAPAGTPPNPASVLRLVFADDSTLYTSGYGGVRRWDLVSGHQELVIGTGEEITEMVMRPSENVAVITRPNVNAAEDCSILVAHDLAQKTSRELPAFGSCVGTFDLDPKGRVLVAGDRDGVLRVGRLSGGDPHLLVGHVGNPGYVAVSPDLKWVASTGNDRTLRLWPMPDLDKPPLHSLPHGELVAKLKSLTNLRAVRDPKAPAGWRIDVGPFPGWKNVPEW